MPAGRPTKLTPELQESICNILRAGNYLEPAAIMNGVSKVTLYAWLKRGAAERERLNKAGGSKPRKKEAPYMEFLNAVKAAQAEAEIRDVALIATAAKTQWQAAAWRLERKCYERWGRKQAIEHTGKDGGAIKAEAKTGLSDETIDAIKRKILGIEDK